MCNLFCKLFIGYRGSKPEWAKLSAICHNFSDSSPMLEQKPLDNAVSPTVLQSNRMRSLLTSVTFSPPTPSELQFSLQTIPQQAIQIPCSAGTDFQCRAHRVVDHRLRMCGTLKHAGHSVKHAGHSNTQTCFPPKLIPWAWKQPFLHGDEHPLCRQSPNSATLFRVFMVFLCIIIACMDERMCRKFGHSIFKLLVLCECMCVCVCVCLSV